MISGTRLSETGQWFESTEGTRWWFDSGALSLDFAYSGGLGAADGRIDSPWEQLQSPVDLDAWLAERLPSTAASAQDLADAKTLRAAITAIATTLASGRPAPAREVDVLNLYAATPNIPPRLDGGSRQAGRTAPRAGQALSTVARDAVSLFSTGSAERIRECDADDCTLIYLDTSRARNRRWCSMQRCGNRHKVRAHRAREAATA